MTIDGGKHGTLGENFIFAENVIIGLMISSLSCFSRSISKK